MNPFINLPVYPLYEVQMNKMDSSLSGPLQSTEYVRAATISNAMAEARRLHPGYSPRANIRKM